MNTRRSRRASHQDELQPTQEQLQLAAKEVKLVTISHDIPSELEENQPQVELQVDPQGEVLAQEAEAAYEQQLEMPEGIELISADADSKVTSSEDTMEESKRLLEQVAELEAALEREREERASVEAAMHEQVRKLTSQNCELTERLGGLQMENETLREGMRKLESVLQKLEQASEEEELEDILSDTENDAEFFDDASMDVSQFDNVTPFSCDKCGKQFEQRMNLIYHKISSHSGGKPYK